MAVQLIAGPSLDDLSHDPSRIRGLAREVLVAHLLTLAAIESAIAVELLTGEKPKAAAAFDADDRMLTPDEAAVIVRRSRRWIYKNARRLSFVIRVSRKSLLCSEKGI